MGPTYNSLLLEQFFFPLLNFSFFLLFSFSLFVPYFFSFFDVFPIFFLSLFYLWKNFLIFSFCIKEPGSYDVELWKFIQRMSMIFFIINDLCISLLYTQYTFFCIFLLHCSNFIKMCARRGTQIMTYFFY